MPSTGVLTKPGVSRPRRRLPRPVPPFHHETFASYVRRLEIANGLPADRTGANLGIKPGDDAAEVLGALTGRSAAALRYALPELGTAGRRLAPVLHGEPTRTHGACQLCSRRAGIALGVLFVWVTHEEVVCLHHRRWLGSPLDETTQQLDLAAHPDVLAAWRRHRNLVTRRGRTAVHDVYETSTRIVSDWHHQNRPLPAVTARLDRLRAGRPCTYLDPAVHAARYPAAVALTALLTSPHWRHFAFNADDTRVRQFLQRVADTVTDGYHPTGGQDPLRHHLNTEVPALRVLPTPNLHLDEGARI